jgi:HEAT repeat protein
MKKRPEMLNGIRIPYAADIEDLRLELRNPGPEAWAACVALGHKSEWAALEILTELGHSEDWRFRRAAIEAIAAHPFAYTRAELLCRSLGDPSQFVVRTACQVAGQLKLDCAHDYLLELASSRLRATRIAALGALERMWQPSDFELVFSIFLRDPSKEVRRRAAWTIRRNVDEENWERVFEVWRTDSLHRHRVWACEVAAKFGDHNHIARLSGLLEDADGHVRKAARKSIAELDVK